ncbi:Autophagy protein 22 [Ceratocystis pirilliformis]|uniref:Autophagy-related protein n=1 Tax=Ceratocystis pirilliformis TaxID=259994 RepID=A0ABR3YZP7_9PEZI
MPSPDPDPNSEEDPLASPALRYPGEDIRPTSSKEISGWYMYAFASEVYVICASFIPILLETLSRENGHLLHHPDRPCPASHDRLSSSPPDPTPAASAVGDVCVVTFLGLDINTTSFAMYTFSVSVLLQALVVVSISCAADHGTGRKQMLLAFAALGSISVMGFLFVTSRMYLIGAVLTIISNTSFGASFVLLNSFLPLLVRNHPEVARLKSGRTDDNSNANSSRRTSSDETPLLSDDSVASVSEITSVEMRLSGQISSTGVGIGYCAALFVQLICIAVVIMLNNTTWSQRVVLFLVGLWWAVFTIPSALWLRPRPGPPLPRPIYLNGRSFSWRVALSDASQSWINLWRTVKLARRLLDVVLFLGGWFLLSDAIATTSSTAILFAKTQMHMTTWALGMINVISTVSGVIGAFSWALISRSFGLQPHHTLLACIALFELVPLYGLLGYLPIVQRWGVGGLQQPWEMYPLAGVYGFVLGGLSAYCRSVYGELIPPGSETAFYALYAITDKGSSVFGPAIVGFIIDRSGDIRPAFWFLAAMVGLPAVFMSLVDIARGKHEGKRLAAQLDGLKTGYPEGTGSVDRHGEDEVS